LKTHQKTMPRGETLHKRAWVSSGIGHRSKIHLTPMKRHVLILGLVGGVLIAILRWSEYQFLVIEHSFEIYGALVAIIFAAFGIWLGVKLTKPREKIILREVLIPSPPTSPSSTPSASPPANSKSSASLLRASATARSPTASSSARTPSKPTAAALSTNSAPAAAPRPCS